MALNNRTVVVQGRLSYAHLAKPHAPNDQAEPKYSVSVLIPKTDPNIAAINTAIDAALQDGVTRGIWSTKPDSAAFRYPPLRDGDAPTDSGESRGQEYAGHAFISAKNKRPVFLRDAQNNEIPVMLADQELYSGCYANVALEFFAYSNSGNKGVTASLLGVQKVRDGEKLGEAGPSADDLFGAAPAAQPTGGFGQPAQAPAAQPAQPAQAPAAQPAQQQAAPGLGF